MTASLTSIIRAGREGIIVCNFMVKFGIDRMEIVAKLNRRRRFFNGDR
jgi:hypothetical protein